MRVWRKSVILDMDILDMYGEHQMLTKTRKYTTTPPHRSTGADRVATAHKHNIAMTECEIHVAADMFSTQHSMTHSPLWRSAPKGWRGMTTVMIAFALLATLANSAAWAQTGDWSAWSVANITDKNQTRTCNAGTGNTCMNAYSAGTTNNGGTETRPSETFWENYLVNGPAGYTNATRIGAADVVSVVLGRNNNNGQLELSRVSTSSSNHIPDNSSITTEQTTTDIGTLFAISSSSNIARKFGLTRPNRSTWVTIRGEGMVIYRPSSGNAVALVDTLCTVTGNLRVRWGTMSNTEQTVPAGSSLCNKGASALAITKQVIGALSTSDDYIYTSIWGEWSVGNITDKNQTRTCNAGTGSTCMNAYGGRTTNHGGTETRPSETFWNNYLVNGPAGYTNATEFSSLDITGVTLSRNNSDGRLQLSNIRHGQLNTNIQFFITTDQATPSAGELAPTIDLKSGLTRPNLSTWVTIPGEGMVIYRPTSGNAVFLVDSLCTASGDLRVRSGQTSGTEQTVQVGSSLCNKGASASAITRQAIAALSTGDDYIYSVGGWSDWSVGNITGKNQTRTCYAGTGNTCNNTYTSGTTNHGGTETRASITFWRNYLVNGPAGHTDATERNGEDVTSVRFLSYTNDGSGALRVRGINTTLFSTPLLIPINQPTPGSGTLFENIVLKSALSRPNLDSWTPIPGLGIVFYRPSSGNAVALVDTLCTATGDLRVRSGQTTGSEQTVQANSPLCNTGASAAAITRQAIGELSATDNYIYAAVSVTLGALQDSTPATPANVGDILTAGAVSHPTLTVNISAHQWQRCPTQDCSSATAISPGGTAATYTVQAADRGNWLRVRVTQGGDFNDTLFSNILQVSRRGAIGPITGTARVGSTLTAGAVTDPDASPNTDVGTITHEWQTATASAGPFTAAPGTNNTATYTIASDQSQIGVWLRVIASYPNAGGGYLTSDPVAVAGVRVSPTALNVTEGDTTNYTLMLGSRPAADVTIAVTNSGANAAAVTLSTTSLTFTTDNWNSVQTVTVSGVEDTDADHETVQLTHTATSTDADYAGGVTIDSVAVTLTDNDTAGVTVSPTTLAVDEAGSGTYTLALTRRPTVPVTIMVSNPDATAVTLSATSLTFTTDNWNSVQTVTVSGVEDTDADHETVQLTHTATSGDAAYDGAAVTIDPVAVTLNDNDTPGVTVSTTTLTVNERGGTGMYTLRLNTPPTEAVTISVTHSNAAAVTVSPTSLMFGTTDWNTAKTITVTGVEDADTDDETVQLTHTVTSTDTNYRTVTAATVTVTVTETAAVSLDVDGSGGNPNQSDGLLLGRYLFGIRDAAGLLDTIPGSPSFNAVTANIAGAFTSGRLDVDGSGGDPNQSDGLLLGRYLFGIRDAVGLLDTIPGNPSFNEVRTNIEALLR